MEKRDYVKEYLAAYKTMKDAAIEKMKKYGRILEVAEVCRERFMKEKGYASVKEIFADEFDDYWWNNSYSCIFEGRHEILYCCRIVMVRYNKDTKDVDVYLESDEGDIAEWFPASYVSFDVDAVYMTVHDFIED